MKPRGRKPRADSRLKTLPEKRQAEIAELCRDKALAEVVELLRSQGLKTSSGALSTWLAWRHLRERLERNQTVVETLLADLKRHNPALTDQELEAAGNQLFSALAIEQQDAGAWAITRRLALKQRGLELEARRVKLLEEKARKADEALSVTKATGLSAEQKMARFREIFGLQ